MLFTKKSWVKVLILIKSCLKVTNVFKKMGFQVLFEELSVGFNPYSAGIDFSGQNLTSVDVRL